MYATSTTKAQADSHPRTLCPHASADMQALPSEVESLNHSVMAAAELLLQYAETMRRNMQNLAGALGSVAEEVQAEGAGLITAQ